MDDTTSELSTGNFELVISRRRMLELTGFVGVSTLLAACGRRSSSTGQEDVEWYHPIDFLNAQASTQLQSLNDSGLPFRQGERCADDGPLDGMTGSYVIKLSGALSDAVSEMTEEEAMADGEKATAMQIVFDSVTDEATQVADSADAAVSEVVTAFELGDAERVAGDAAPVPNSANTIELYFAWGKCSIDDEDGAWLTRLNYAHYADSGDTTARQVVVFVGTLGSLGYEDYADCTEDFDSGDPQIFHNG